MNLQEITENKARQVTQHLLEHENIEVKTIDLILILTIAGFVLQLFSYIHDKKHSSEEALAIIKKPGIMQRWILRRRLRSYLGDKYKNMQGKILRGLQEVGAQTSQEEINNIYKELSHV